METAVGVHSSVPHGVRGRSLLLFGREADLEALRGLLVQPSVRALTITGPPGVGKTRMAIALAEALADTFGDSGFIDFTTISTIPAAISAIADALGMDGTDPAPIEPAAEETLLILDNFEHLIGAGTLLSEFLDSRRGLKLLLTSRVPLRVTWEHQYPLVPLPVPPGGAATAAEIGASPSVQLFVSRLTTVQPHFTLSAETAEQIAAICRQLEGLPMAIELAAAQAKLFPLPEIANRLERRLEFLRRGPSDLPARHATLRASIGWSYSLLDSNQQAALRALGVFGGTFEYRAAETVCATGSGPAEQVTDAIGGLVDASLVQVAAGPDGQHRLLMLETIRAYALECLAQAGEAEQARTRHASYFCGLANLAANGLQSAAEHYWLDHLDADNANFGLALSHLSDSGRFDDAAELASTLWRFWWRRGHLARGQEQLRALLANPAFVIGSRSHARVLMALGILGVWGAHYAEARVDLERAIELARRHSDARTLAYALTFLGRIARDQGSPDAADLATESVRLQRETMDAWGLGLALHFRGLTLMAAEPDSARLDFEECATIFRGLGCRGELAMPLRGLGLLAYQDGDFEAAGKFLEESTSHFLERGDEWSAGMVAHDLGYVALSQGRINDAADRFGESLRNWIRLDNRRGQVSCVAGVAGVAVHAGQAREAAELLGAVDALTEQAGIVLEPTDLATLESIRTLTISALGERTFEAGVRAGRDLSLAEAGRRSAAIAEQVTAVPHDRSATQPLSRREMEVAALVRAGLSNREIAAQLVISEGTAGIHVKHILGKLGFRSRAQVAAWAAETGLGGPAGRGD